MAKSRVKKASARPQPVPKMQRRKARPEAATHAPELAEMLGPISVDTFMREYRQQKPLHIPGDRKKLARLIRGGYSRRDMLEGAALAAARRVPGFYSVAHQTAGFDHGGSQSMAADVAPSEIENKFKSGCNIQVAFQWDERLMTLMSRVKTQIGSTGEAALYATLSPAGFGWPPHIDNVEVFFVQTEGHKRMLISDAPVFEYPRGTVSFSPAGKIANYEFAAMDVDRIDQVDMSNLREIVLAPGDVFYCPSGVLHGTKAIDETLTVLMAYKATSSLDLIYRTLKPRLLGDANWRHIPAAHMKSATGELSPEVHDFFADRLAELRKIVNELTPEALSVELAQAVAFAGTGVQMPMRQPQRPERTIRKADRFRVGRVAPLTWTRGTSSDGAPAFFIFSGNREVSVGDEWMPFLERLAQSDEVRADETMRWSATKPYPWSEVQEMFAALMENGVVDLVN